MEDKHYQSLLSEISTLNDRIQKIEKKIFPVRVDNPPPSLPKATVRNKQMKIKEAQRPSNILGYVGASCLLFAIILLVKFSIDSGWLTPLRQMLLATLFGLSLIFVPFFNKFEDHSYIAILPAVGLAALHLTIYGGVFYHTLLSPLSGLICTSLVGILSLFLLSTFKEESYAVMAAGGTYLGAILLKDSFTSLHYFSYYILTWNIIFAASAIKLKNRSIIVLSAYFSLFLLIAISNSSQDDLKWPVAILQTIQMIIFSFATYLYTVENKTRLTLDEAKQFLPVYLFFYGHVFYILDKINPNYATSFAVIFSIILLVLHQIAKTKLNKEKMDSSSIIYLFISIVLAHSLFFVAMNDIFQYATVAIILVISTFATKHPQQSEFKGVKIVVSLVVAYGILSLSFSPATLANWKLATFGLIYGILAISNAAASVKNKILLPDFMLMIAHSQIIIAIYRLKEFIGEYAISPLWIIYAFVILYLGMKQQHAKMARSVFPVIFIAIAYFIFNTFSLLDQGQRILSLIIMGGLIYACGYFYRKIRIGQ